MYNSATKTSIDRFLRVADFCINKPKILLHLFESR